MFFFCILNPRYISTLKFSFSQFRRDTGGIQGPEGNDGKMYLLSCYKTMETRGLFQTPLHPIVQVGNTKKCDIFQG